MSRRTEVFPSERRARVVAAHMGASGCTAVTVRQCSSGWRVSYTLPVRSAAALAWAAELDAEARAGFTRD